MTAFPILEDTTLTTRASNSTTNNVSMPATVNANDLLIVIKQQVTAGNTTTPGGWTNLLDTNRMHVSYKVAAGNEDGTTVNFADSNSQHLAAACLRIRQGTYWSGSNFINAGTEVTAGTTTVNPPSLNPANWGTEDTLWLAIATAVAAGGVAVTVTGSPPSNYSNGGQARSSSSTTDGVAVYAFQRSRNAASEDPGAITIAASSGPNKGGNTLAIRPAYRQVSLAGNQPAATGSLTNDLIQKRSTIVNASSNSAAKPTGLANGDFWDIRYSWFATSTSLPVNPGTGWTEVVNEVRSHGASDYIGHARWVKQITNAAGESTINITRAGGTVFWDGTVSVAVKNALAVEDSGGNRGTSTAPGTGSAIDSTISQTLLIIGSTTYGQNQGTPSGMTQDYEIDGGDVEGWYEFIAGTLSGASRATTIGASVEWIWSFVLYSKNAGADEVTVSGNQPAATGTIAALKTQFKSLSGNQAAPSGALVAKFVNKLLTGAQPAASGALTVKRVLTHITLTGNQPAATGTIVGAKIQFAALAGNQPAPSGALTVKRVLTHITLAGNQAAPSGALALIKTLKSLAGNQPAPSGALTVKRVLTHITLTGNQPAAAGALTIQRVLTHITLAGNQPAPSGTVADVSATFVSAAGNQPAPSGALVALFAAKLVQGDQPSATGALISLHLFLVTLSGNQAFATGALTAAAPARNYTPAPEAASARIPILQPSAGTANGPVPPQSGGAARELRPKGGSARLIP